MLDTLIVLAISAEHNYQDL